MQINYLAPLSKAWNRMLYSLFRPFHIKKWFILGFTAFLANLMDFQGGGGSDNGSENGDFDVADIFEAPDEIMRWFESHPQWVTLIILGIALIVGIIILITWLSSRGKFMFLDNVANDRALVKQPWTAFKETGKSLFLWRLGFGVVATLIIASFSSHIFFEIRDMYYSNATDSEMIIASLQLGLILAAFILICAYISLFLNDFVVPLMYKNSSNTWIGWSRFMLIFSRHFIYFVLYGLVKFTLYLIVIFFIVIIGFMTCCIGFLILLIPYISSVILLPVSVTFRAFSLEFLEQFGPEYKIFPENNTLPE